MWCFVLVKILNKFGVLWCFIFMSLKESRTHLVFCSCQNLKESWVSWCSILYERERISGASGVLFFIEFGRILRFPGVVLLTEFEKYEA